MDLLKRIYRCDPVPWTILYVLLSVILGAVLVAQAPDCAAVHIQFSGLQFTISSIIAKSISLLILVLLPFWFRNTLSGTAILDFSERVSLYPLTLFSMTILMSCNSLSWTVIMTLILALFVSIIHLEEGESMSVASFKSGLFISILGLFSPYFFLLLLFALPAFSMIRSLDWRAVVWSFLGILTPYYLIVSLSYIITGHLPLNSYAPLLHVDLVESSNKVGLSAGLYILIIITISVLVFIRTLRTSRKGIVKRRKILRVGMLLFAFAIVVSLFLFQFTPSTPYLGILSLPMSILCLEFMKDDAPKLESLLFVVWVLLTFVYLWN